jgi:CMP-N,N'-diacetyllegionaminic acid synthase
LNKLYEEGNKVVIWTARGALTGINWMPFTQAQLNSWGAKYHELKQKPYFDVLVDDKALSDKDYFNGN